MTTLQGPPQAHEQAGPPRPAHDGSADGSAAMTMPPELGATTTPMPQYPAIAGTAGTAGTVGADGGGDGGVYGAGLHEDGPHEDDLYEVGSGQGRASRRPGRRRGPALWLGAGAAVVAVVGIAAFAGGLFSGSDEQGFALPDMPTSTRVPSEAPRASAAKASAPQSGATSHSPAPSASASSSESAAGSASASRSADASPGTPAGSSEPPAVAAAGATAASPAPSTVRATDAAEQSPEPAGPVLSRGDRGPEVAELQDRLAQAEFYNGPGNGQFNDRLERAVSAYQSSNNIQGDPAGTYGPHTRRALEAETQEP